MDREFVEDLQDPEFVAAFIKEWNESRLDMFALSPPNEHLVFSGVMRFYFQDRGQKAATKCIRVTNKQTVADVMATLIEKFCPDMKMLSTPNYELYEIHGTGDVRKLGLSEYPLLVQLLWHNDDREGRFVLKSADLKIQPAKFFEVNIDEGQLKRRLSRREKKDLKKKRKEQLKHRSEEKLLADHVYRELPESSFTRTISNPEAVMRRRRQQKLEKRMKEFTSKGGPQTGGILKIFAESLKPEIPYKTILASVKDNSDVITKAALDKFLLSKEDPANYCIVMAIIPLGDNASLENAKERIIRSSDCPLAIQNSWPKNNGLITFHLRRRAQGNAEPKREKEVKSKSNIVRPPVVPEKPKPPPPERKNVPNISHVDVPMRSIDDDFDRDEMPYFLELTPEGKEINYKPKIYYIKPHETIIGSSRNPSPGVQYLQLFSPKILASHCSIVNADGTVSIVPHGPEADVRVGVDRVYDNTLLQTGDVVQFGGLHTFRFCNPLDFVNTRYESPEASPHMNKPEYQYAGYNHQKSFTTPPISPELKERILNEQIGSNIDDSDDDNEIETTFGVDGEVETSKTKKQIYSAHSAENLLGSEPNSIRDSFKKHRQSAPDLMNIQDPSIDENLLPASLTFLDHGKDAFFATVTSEVNGSAVSFKLAPTYTLYLAARHLLSPGYRAGLSPVDRSRVVATITKRIATSIQQTIQENDCLAGGLAFWMANASELLHFYRQDIDLGPITQAAQAILAQSIQESFALLVNAMEEELSLALPAFLDPTDSVDILPRDLDSILNDDLLERAESMELLNWTTANVDNEFNDPRNIDRQVYTGEQWITPAARIRYHGIPIMADVLYILSSAMSLLRRCRVNAALTIQLFSQLFHFINMWTFNRIVLEPDLKLCSRLWGHCLRMRLSFIEAWAERQGLELAADCHLARVIQAAHLLEATKDSAEAIADVASACFKLNSLQLRTLLENYLPEMDEPIIPQELIDSIVSVAESTADELTQTDGREVKLEEDIQLQLPFLLPEEGYSSDIIRGVPPGLQEFLEPLCSIGVCELTFNPQSHGLWTVYQVPYNKMEDMDEGGRESQVMEELPIQRITIDKGKSGLGLSICATKGAQSDFTGIYIKAVIVDGLAAKDGRLEAGDQILSVNESSLIDVSQTQAAKIMGKSGPVITLEVMKGAAFYHGLSKLVEGEINMPQPTHPPPKVEPDTREETAPIYHAKQGSNDSRDRIVPEKVDPQYNHRREKSADSGKSRSDEDIAPPRHVAPPPPAHRKQRSTDSGKSRTADEAVVPPIPAHRKQRSADSGKSRSDEEPTRHEEIRRKKKENYGTEKPDSVVKAVYHSRESSNDSGVVQTEIPEPVIVEVPVQPTVEHAVESVAEPAIQRVVEKEVEYFVASAAKEEETAVQYNDSDYDSDGNLMTKDEKEKLKRQRQRQKEYEERLAKWEEQRKRQEEDEKLRLEEEEKRHVEELQRQIVEEKRKEDLEEQMYEEEVRRKQAEKAAKEEAERIRLEKENIRKRELERLEEKRRHELEKIRREEEERKQREIEEKLLLEEEEKLREEAERLLQEELQRKREERQKEEERARSLEMERIRKQREEDLRRAKEEEDLKRLEMYRMEQQRMKEEERSRKEEEERARLLEAERIRKLREEDIRRAKEEEEDRKRLEMYRMEQQRMKEEERLREEEERRKEKLRMIEERKRKEEEESELRAQRERRRVEEEEKRRKEYEAHVERRRIEHEKVVKESNEREQRKRDAEKERLQKEEEEKATKKSVVNEKREQFNKEMSSLDDALREAERIAAEMDMFMIEEEQKIEDDIKEKHKQEKYKWQTETAPTIPTSPFNYEPSNLKKSLSRENLIETNIDDVGDFPSPPTDLLPAEDITSAYAPVRIETNIDSSSEEEKSLSRASNSSSSLRQQTSTTSVQEEQQRWLHEQREKREKYRQEQERLRQERLAKEEDERTRQMKEIEARRLQENKQMEEYRRFKEEKERKDREEAARRKAAPKPPVKAKNFKLKNGTTDLPNVIIPTRPLVRKSSSEEEDAPPRPPPPKNVKSPTYSPISSQPMNSRNSNGFPDINRNISQTKPTERTASPTPSSQGSFGRRTPEAAIVNQGVEVPEVLDFKSKMKLFGKFQG